MGSSITVTLNANATISSESGFLLLNGNTSLDSNTLTVNPSTGTLGFGNNTMSSQALEESSKQEQA